VRMPCGMVTRQRPRVTSMGNVHSVARTHTYFYGRRDHGADPRRASAQRRASVSHAASRWPCVPALVSAKDAAALDDRMPFGEYGLSSGQDVPLHRKEGIC
jgi:hypothetical protein